MRNVVVAALLLALAGCSSTPSTSLGPDPRAYDYPFRGKVYTHYLSPADMAQWCGTRARGCSIPTDRGTSQAVCSVYINSGYRGNQVWIAKIKQHENRRCNGYVWALDY